MSANAPTVIFVRKRLAGGQSCGKCREIERRLVFDGLMQRLDQVLEAVEGDAASAGAVIAARHGVSRAPFFVIRHADGREQVIESYLAFKRWFSAKESTAGELQEAVDRHPELALL